ncbi:MAG: sulfotransferase domain-containing protein [Alphaproteobacteria bacterium]|nr:sulfotransferase domain-containing protein [Rhodospirillaceae bacterium]MDG2479955.1 sulfotransferase domain-containing protein [Alphaproteobacteria bacterium]MBT6203298.1 sulfotransferase domain-containing protein [Rhodospirillaceae bacterium]MBT6510148.1 sulfotransferase domain-containing protein [Rhodospirillaceae bacterium]MBT7614430.1 sulfotransferase domain-containing protein [Rhodospirillaceae bacterium]
MGQIIWIASYPKSGNTWTRAFLHNVFRDPQSSFNINDLTLLTANEAANANYWDLDPRPWQEWSNEDVAAMRATAQARLAASRAHTIFCKTHLAVMEVRKHATINLKVTAGAIYLIRNPLDIVISYADHQGLTIDQQIELLNLENYETPNADTLVNEPMGSWSQHVESWTGRPNPALYVMRYEDMVANPVKAFSGLVKYLQIDAPRSRIERAVKNSSFKVLRHQEELHGFAEKTIAQKNFFRSGKCGEWKDVLSEEQVAAICNNHRDQMTRFGYLPEGY